MPRDPGPRALGERLIVAYKAAKTLLELALAAGLVVAASRGELEALRHLAFHLEREVASRWAVLAGRALGRLVSERGIHLAEIGLALDGVVSAVEGWALAMGYRWGAWLVVVATATPFPLEVYEIARRPSAPRLALAVVNVAVVLYLARRIARRRATLR